MLSSPCADACAGLVGVHLFQPPDVPGEFEDRDGTGRSGTDRARRPGGPLFMVFIRGHPRGQRVARRQGGQQSGAAGDAPLPKIGFAGRQKNNGGVKLPINNRPAIVAIDWLTSQARRPDATAARHTDARSLAVPVPRSTMNPTGLPSSINSDSRPSTLGD